VGLLSLETINQDHQKLAPVGLMVGNADFWEEMPSLRCRFPGPAAFRSAFRTPPLNVIF
jgi:hypothetical protein